MTRSQRRRRSALLLGAAVLVPVGVAAGAVGWHVWDLNSGPMAVAPAAPVAEFAGPAPGQSAPPAGRPKPSAGDPKAPATPPAR